MRMTQFACGGYLRHCRNLYGTRGRAFRLNSLLEPLVRLQLAKSCRKDASELGLGHAPIVRRRDERARLRYGYLHERTQAVDCDAALSKPNEQVVKAGCSAFDDCRHPGEAVALANERVDEVYLDRGVGS